MSFDTMNTCAAITLAAAIDDMVVESGESVESVRKEILESKAYECLLDFDSGLWAEGPDYFRDYYRSLSEKNDIAVVT